MKIYPSTEESVPEVPEQNQFFIGQRIFYHDVICTIIAPRDSRKDTLWIYNPAREYSHWIAKENARPLPGGQL